MNDKRIQRQLLAERETKLDFKRALEPANKNSRELQTGTESQRCCRCLLPQTALPSVISVGGVTTSLLQVQKHGCHNCGQMGHLKTSSLKRKRNIKNVQDQEETPKKPASPMNQIKVTVAQVQPIMVDVELNGHLISMELDSGASVSLISAKTDRDIFKDEPLQASTTALTTYSGQRLEVVGKRQVEVVVEGQRAMLPLIVVAGEGQSLIGRDCLRGIRRNWKSIGLIQRQSLMERDRQITNRFCRSSTNESQFPLKRDGL